MRASNGFNLYEKQHPCATGMRRDVVIIWNRHGYPLRHDLLDYFARPIDDTAKVVDAGVAHLDQLSGSTP